jgi:O-antigen ligase
LTLSPRSFRDRLIVEGSVALAVALPLAAIFAYRGYTPILFIIAAIAATRRRHWIYGLKPVTPPIDLKDPFTAAYLAIVAFCLWIAITGFWSPTPSAALKYFSVSGIVLAAGFIVAEIFSREARDIRFLAATVVTGTLIAAALFFFEAHTGGYLRLVTPPADASTNRFDDITDLGRGLTALLPSLYPALAVLLIYALRSAGARRYSLYALIAVVIGAVFSAAIELTIAANSLAVLAGVASAAIAAFLPRTSIAGLVIVFIAALVAAPLLVFLPVDAIAAQYGDVLPVSWLQRFFIWQNTAALALDCLPFGCGVDYARTLSEAGATIDLPRSPIPLALMPTHPHNGFLQIWLELGLPGVLLFACFLLAGGILLLRAKIARAVTAGLAGAGGVIFVLAFVDMGIWREWRLASVAIAVAGGAIAHRLWMVDATREHSA